MAKKKPPPVDDQPQIPDLQDERDEALIRAAKKYQRILNQKKESSRQLEEAHDAILKIMHQNGITKYRYKSLSIEIGAKERARVTVETNDDEEKDE